VPLSALRAGDAGVVVDVRSADPMRADRLLAAGVTPGAQVIVLQTFPAIVFTCDQTELAVELRVAEAIWVNHRRGCCSSAETWR
jgi:Fe2+ transport system protein FeoA